jgi:mono/diheme cytochrome c family protein
MNFSNWTKALIAILLLSFAVQVRIGDSANTSVLAQEGEGGGGGQTAKKEPYKGMPPDPWDRNARMVAYTRSGFESGAGRGLEIYYMNCWMCHSEYVIAGDKWPTPTLRDVSKRLSDEMIKITIRSGGARMPAFSEKMLSDADINDLLALFKEKCGTFKTGGGCFDEHNPPKNPLYKYESTVLNK